jgi:pimeloyl-ACP methyl ester carboxylesterase
MTRFVLVHGAMSGAWVWPALAAHLQAAGRTVDAPTLTGLGERAHLAHPDVDLDTHIDDVTGVLEAKDLRQAVLVGKSYAGLVITGAADRVPERIAWLVYVDALVPRDGESMLDLQGPRVAARMRAAVAERGAGWRLPAGSAAEPRLTDQPFSTFTQPIRLSNPAAARVRRAYVRAAAQAPSRHAELTAEMAQRARADGWPVWEVPAGHNLEQTAPEALAAILLGLPA